MNITASPATNGMYFHRNIPDFVIAKTDSNTSLSFTLSKGGSVILSEKYSYDAADSISIKHLWQVVEYYFSASELVIPFTWSITEGSTTVSHSFTAIKCDTDMTVDAAAWTARNFLTRSYRQKRTAIGYTELLSFVQKVAQGAVSVMYKVVYQVEESTTEYSGVLQTIAVSSATKVTSFNASVALIIASASLPNTVTILQYDIWLSGTSFETAKYTYLVDRSPYRNKCKLMFANSFGVYETYTATGRSDAARKNELTLGTIDNRLRKLSQDFAIENTINSGIVSESEMTWLDDLLYSYSVGIYEGATIADEITITDSDKKDSTANELHSFELKYKRANTIHLQLANAARGVFDPAFNPAFE